jgi:transcription initiation factor TFIIB
MSSSNLTSCHGVFIPSTTHYTHTTYTHDYQHKLHQKHGTGSNHTVHSTKKNKKGTRDTIWANIEEAFLPELLEEERQRTAAVGGDTTATDIIKDDTDILVVPVPDGTAAITVPEYVHHSPKPTTASFHHAATAARKLSSLFIKPETNVECLYRNSGIRENCDVCSSDVVLTDDGFLTCKNPACSILYKDESLDQSAEWRYYGADDNQASDPTRCGMPVNPLLKESSYGCKVMCEGKSYSQDMMKIRRYTEWQSMPYHEKAQYDMFQKITTIAQNKGISKMIIDEALRVHKRISEHKTFRSLNRDGVVGASIYISCKIHNCPRTAKEIATIFNLDNTSATKGCKNAVSIINELESNLDNSEKTNFCKTKPEAFIERYCSRLNINDELTKLCQFIAVMIEKQNMIPENTPHSIASGIIYFVADMCHLSITKKDVNRVSDMSEVTINKCYKKLYEMRDKLIPKMILNKYQK